MATRAPKALMSLSLFNQSFTGDQLGAMLAAESDAAAGVLAPVELSQHNRLWFCKRHAFEVGELRTRGVPAAVADAFNDRAHHLYLIVGPDAARSRAHEYTPANGVEMLDAMYAQMQQKGALRIPGAAAAVATFATIFGRAFAARQFGTGEHAAVAGPSVFALASHCWESPLPSRCSVADVDRLAAAFTARDERFNLLNNNCAHFACALLSSCGTDGNRTAADAAEPRPWWRGGWRRGRRRRYSAPNPLGGGGAADACSYDDCVESFMSEMFTGRHGHPGCGFERFELVTEVTENP